MGVEHLIDVSTLPAPEPLEAVLDALTHLSPGDYLRVLHRREPWPLFPILEERGFASRLLPGQQSAGNLRDPGVRGRQAHAPAARAPEGR